MKNTITTEVSEVTLKSGGNEYRAKQILIFKDGVKVGASYVDCALVHKWRSWLQDETRHLLKLIKV